MVTGAARSDDSRAPLIDLDFLDRTAAAGHASALHGGLRYVDHEVFGDPAGVLIEEGATNGVEDASYEGARPLPTGWQERPDFIPSSAYTVSFVRRGVGRGRLRLQGGAACDCYITLGSARFFPVSAGDHLTGSMAIRLAEGDVAKLKGAGLLIVENDANGKIANTAPVVAPIQQMQTDKPWWAQVRTVVGRAGFANLVLKVVTSGTFDLTFDIDSPQLEKRGWRSSFHPKRRDADDVKLVSPESYLAHPGRALLITADMPRHVPVASLWSEYADDKNYIEILSRDWCLFAKVVTDGNANEIRLGVVPPLMRFTVCLATRPNGLAASLNAKPTQTLNCPMPQMLKSVIVGGGPEGKWNSTIARLTLFRGPLADPAQLSNRTVEFYDDFDREDAKSLGRSPTGHFIQSINRLATNQTAIVGKKWVAVEGGMGPAFATYSKITLPRVPRYLGAVMTWTTGRSGGAAGLIFATNDMSGPTDALHTIVSDYSEVFQTISNSQFDPILATFVFPAAMNRDGQTPYGIACMLNARESAVVYVGPQGDLPRHVSPTYVSRAGRIAVFEHYWQITRCRPEFHAVAAF